METSAIPAGDGLSAPDKYVNELDRHDLGLGRMNRQRFNYFFAVWAGRRREIDSLIIRILFKRQRNPKSCSFSGVAFNCDIARDFG